MQTDFSIGYKGQTWWKVPIVYAPYIPLHLFSVVELHPKNEKRLKDKHHQAVKNLRKIYNNRGDHHKSYKKWMNVSIKICNKLYATKMTVCEN